MRITPYVFALPLLTGLAPPQQPQGYVPTQGFVPDSATAVRIAVAVWMPIYGERQIMSEQPFVATLKDSVWTVSGSLPQPPAGAAVAGGTAVVRIAKRDGRILFVQHYR